MLPRLFPALAVLCAALPAFAATAPYTFTTTEADPVAAVGRTLALRGAAHVFAQPELGIVRTEWVMVDTAHDFSILNATAEVKARYTRYQAVVTPKGDVKEVALSLQLMECAMGTGNLAPAADPAGQCPLVEELPEKLAAKQTETGDALKKALAPAAEPVAAAAPAPVVTAMAEPVKAEPAKTEPVKAEPAKAAVPAAAVAPAPAPAAKGGGWSDFVDTRLTFAFCDDDIRKGSGESIPNSPSPNFGCGAQNTQFFENYETKTSGFDNFSNLVLYKKVDTFFPGLSADAALALRINQAALLGTNTGAFRDESSYLRLTYRPEGWGEKDNIQFVGFPISSDRFRLGYSYRISWGGNALFPTLASRPSKPGAKVQLTKGGFTTYLGLKTAIVQETQRETQLVEQDAAYGLLGGASYEITPGLKVDVNGGFFDRGTNPKQEVLGAPFQTFGGSAQVSYASGDKVGSSIDFALYRNDPNAPQKFFGVEKYPGGLSYTLAAEATMVGTTLADPDPLRSGSTAVDTGFAADLQARIKYDFLRVHMTAMLRDIQYLALNQGGVVPNQAMRKDIPTSSEFFVAVGADYHFPAIRFTPGVTLGVQRSASYESLPLDITGNNPGMENLGKRAIIVREDPSFADRILQEILPNNCGTNKDEACSPKPLVGAKFTARFDLADGLSAAAEVFGNYNPNRVEFVQDQFGVAQRTLGDPLQIGFNVLTGIRF